MSNQQKINRTSLAKVTEACLELGARKATVFQSPKLIIRATRRFKKSGRNTRDEVLLTFGAPNYAERKFIKACQKAGEPLPVRKVQLKWFK